MEPTKEHWEKIYQTRSPEEVSWTQVVPEISLRFIHSFHLPKEARIIDIGAGDSRLADHLLEEGFEQITVLDISSLPLEKARKRLGNQAEKINWIVGDITCFQSENPFDLWHDRAVFHFMISEESRSAYLDRARKLVRPGGFLIIGSFSEKGPEICSGLPVRRYNETSMKQELSDGFEMIQCLTEDHITPFHTKQEFLFCSFRRANPDPVRMSSIKW